MSALRFTVVSVVLAICFVRNGSGRVYEPINSEIVKGVDDINEFMAVHPDAKVEQLQMQSKVRGQINYTLGSRLNGISPLDYLYLKLKYRFMIAFVCFSFLIFWLEHKQKKSIMTWRSDMCHRIYRLVIDWWWFTAHSVVIIIKIRINAIYLFRTRIRIYMNEAKL